MGLERRGCVVQPRPQANWQREEPVGKVKPFDIPKREVWEAFKRVKANQGAAGIDGQSIAEFEANRSGNLYKLWNRLSSGSYFPPPVRRVDIPKAEGGTRPLGIPTVADRVAQEVARRCLEPILEPVFHADSYGYRPGKSAIDAVRQARQRCWRCDWVLDQVPAGAGRDVQPVHSRLDQLFQQLLQDAVASDPEEDRCLCHSMGAPQVQADAPSDQGGTRLARPATSGEPPALRPLASMSWQRPNIGSRVNREVHAR